MADLELAISIAVRAHAGQKDKAGQPYILHPLRLMFAVSGESERICAVLHDVIEDTEATLEDLETAGFSSEVLEALRLLTHEDGVDYFEYVAAISANPIAKAVKLADLNDNMDLTRISTPSAKDHERVERYKRARELLAG